jgi:hypothetical protein
MFRPGYFQEALQDAPVPDDTVGQVRDQPAIMASQGALAAHMPCHGGIRPGFSSEPRGHEFQAHSLEQPPMCTVGERVLLDPWEGFE